MKEVTIVETEVTPFDYNQLDSETAAFLQKKQEKITQIRMMSVMAIGKELTEVHEKLAHHYQGTFGKWCGVIGISRDTAENYIRAYKYVAENFGNIEDADQIQPSLLFAISKPSAPKGLQEKVLSGDITTYKEYKELESKAKIAEQKARDLEEQLMQEQAAKDEEKRKADYFHKYAIDVEQKAQEAKTRYTERLQSKEETLQEYINRQPEVIEKQVEVVIEKEVVPPDYEKVKMEAEEYKKKLAELDCTGNAILAITEDRIYEQGLKDGIEFRNILKLVG